MIDCAVCLLDERGIVISWSPGAARFHGYQQSEIVGESYGCFFVADERRMNIPDQALEIAAKEGRFETEGWRVRNGGLPFWAHVIIDPIHGATGEFTGFAHVIRDLTERKAAEEASRKGEEQFSEEQFRLLVQSVTDYAIFMLDPQGTIISWNAGAQRIKGYEPDDIVGKHFSRFYTQEDRCAGVPNKALTMAAEESRFEAEGWRVRKDGARFWASVVIDAIRDDRGVLLGFAKVTRDITERLESQRALEVAREALFQAQKLEAVGQLTGGVAHDFNNLLMVISSSLDLIRKRVSDDDEKLVGLLDNATQATRRGSGLIQRMLAFARRQELDRKAVDLPELVHGMSDLLQRSIGPSIRIEAHFPIGLPKVETDANQLEAALLNLVVNARDAMPAGGPLTISARDEMVGAGHSTNLPFGKYVCFSVQDSGEGMDEGTLARARDPFFTTKGVGKGTGLGLSMVQGFAEQSGGRLLLKSERGVGTLVEIWLAAVEYATDKVGEQVEPPGSMLKNRQQLTVLAVDDDALVLMNTVAMLEDLGHSVLEAISAKQAIELLRDGTTIDLIISDQAMPHMTGIELMKAVKTEWPGLPFVLATGYSELPEEARSDLPILSKPFSQEQLERAINLAAVKD